MKTDGTRTFGLVNLGCKLNQSEGEVVADLLSDLGYERVHPKGSSDLTIVNTCAVTSRAEFQSRQAIRQAVRRSPGGLVVATGCDAQLRPDDLASAGAQLVVGNPFKERIPELVASNAHGEGSCVLVGDPSNWSGFQQHEPSAFGTHTRAFLKVQEGCNLTCTFCTVRLARGRSRSLSPVHAARRAGKFARSGYREIVLTGVNLAAYGHDLRPATRLQDLLDELSTVPGLSRIRLGSLQPQLVSQAFLDAASRSEVLCDHFHLPLQSGSGRILRLMGRRYTPGAYRTLVHRIRKIWPSAAVGADLIAGFPGETDRDFEETVRMVEELPLAYVHVFPYSPRGGTQAWEFGSTVPPFVRTERAARLRALGNQKRRAFLEAQVGRRAEVLLERPIRRGTWEGLTRNYVRTRVAGIRLNRGAVREVLLTAREGEWVIGVLRSGC